MQVVNGAVNFADLDPDNPEQIPEKWLEKWGEDECKKMLRIVRASWLPGSSAPVALKIAQSTLVGIMKAKAAEKGTRTQLNIQMIAMTSAPSFPKMEVEES